MLAFMRKHQKYFFAVITVVIVISFSFFGTYSTLGGNSIHQQVAFTTVEGQDVTRAELEELAYFIGTDAEDKKLFGGYWGPNFLNNGVIRKDFLETGLASILIEAYGEDLTADFKNRLAKEVRYKPYIHPQAKYISSSNVWKYFAPEIENNLTLLQTSADPLSKEAVEARIQLFLQERQFPSPYLRQILRYQEGQNGGIERDPNIHVQDFSLFGYHTLEDWFGSRFVRLIAEFIFNAASVAESKGYVVSKEEALADLIRNGEMSFKENKDNPHLGVGSSVEYFDQQMTRMRLDKSKAAKIWQKVLLFRRLFEDLASSVFVDPVTYTLFNQHANKGVQGELYRLPEALRFSDFKTLQKFETYLSLVSKKGKAPMAFLSVEEVSKKAPELVHRKYQLEIAEVSKKDLQSSITVKDTLVWELDQKNWEALKVQAPELGLKKGSTKEERLAALESLNGITRGKVDHFAREQIIKAHPERIDAALEEGVLRPITASIPLKGESSAFIGLKSGQELMTLLDKSDEVKKISFDKDHFYRIKVIDREPQLEILTFEDANKSGVLDSLTEQALEIAYVQLRTKNPESYQNSDKSWKPLSEVKDKVALAHFGSVFDEAKKELKGRKDKEKYQYLEGDRLTPYRFLGWGNDLLKKLKSDPEEAKKMTRLADEPQTFENQFKWVQSSLHITQNSKQKLHGADQLLTLKSKEWSDLVLAPNGDTYFAYIEGPAVQGESQDGVLQSEILKARFLLGNDAERSYLRSLIPLLKEKKGISFDYLYAGEPTLNSDA